ncbi:FG-GAP-like repeat-containing protein [Streptomyces sp. NPDC093225]|uniref:C40 family peptidase n=1 Tax=Streptomyces sp. NPDC093225 TaxID=3366034 RepID=UPI0038138E2C
MSRALRRTSTTALLAAGLASVVLTTTVPAHAAGSPAPRSTTARAGQGTITPFTPTVPNPTTATRAQLNAAVPAGRKKVSPFLAAPQGLAAASSVAGPISRAEVIARARTWVDAGVPYSMYSYRTDANGRYRTDCSGFVSMAWHLASSSANNWGETTGTLLEFTSSIGKESLKPGDVLLNPDPGASGHVVIFNGWANAEHTRYDAYEQAGSVGAVHREIPYPYWSGHGTFSPRRYDNIIDDAAPAAGAARTIGADFNGDGKQDIAGIDAYSNMKLYTGDGAGHVSGGSNMLGDNGLWKNFKSIAAGDFNGDGKQDIAGIDANDNMKLYTGDGAGHVSGGGSMLGDNGLWANFKAITAGDFNADGKQDVAGIDANNNLKLYTGDGAGHLGGGSDMLGSNGLWVNFKGITAGDFNADGKQDVAGIDANNNLKLYTGDNAGHLGGGSDMLGSNGLWKGFRSLLSADFNGDGRRDVAGIDANNNMKMYAGDNAGHVSGGIEMLGNNGLWAGF